jgi:UDP:flavonoid glycosyltransferase YjiC (YdhE family)
MIARADVVLFHGGYGTMMETVQKGVPSIVLPFHTEQECNGRRLEQNGSARVLSPQDDDLELLRDGHQEDAFAVLVCRQLYVTARQVKRVTASVLHDSHYRFHAQKLHRIQSEYGAAVASVDLIEDLGKF